MTAWDVTRRMAVDTGSKSWQPPAPQGQESDCEQLDMD